MSIRSGNAPCSWCVEFAQDPRNPPWEKVLGDCAAAGYSGIELGALEYMPEDPAILAEALARHGLELFQPPGRFFWIAPSRAGAPSSRIATPRSTSTRWADARANRSYLRSIGFI